MTVDPPVLLPFASPQCHLSQDSQARCTSGLWPWPWSLLRMCFPQTAAWLTLPSAPSLSSDVNFSTRPSRTTYLKSLPLYHLLWLSWIIPRLYFFSFSYIAHYHLTYFLIHLFIIFDLHYLSFSSGMEPLGGQRYPSVLLLMYSKFKTGLGNRCSKTMCWMNYRLFLRL